MGIIVPSIPKAGTGAQPATDIVSALNTIVTEINGGLDAANIKDGSINDLPVGRWNVVSQVTDMKLMAGPYTPGFPPSYLFGVQQVSDGVYDPAASNVLREVGITMKYSKSEKFAGGNADDNGLLIQGFRGGSGLTMTIGAGIAGTVGVVTDSYVSFVPTTPTTFEGFSVNAALQPIGQNMVMPDVGNFFSIRTTGPFTGTIFTIHEFIIRYRDWEF